MRKNHTAQCASCGASFQTRRERPGKFCSTICRLPAPPIRVLDHVRSEGDCLVFTGARDEDGYGYFSLNNERVRIHRLVLEMKIGRPLAESECALHTCDNPPCAKPSHLFVGTVIANNADKMAKMRYTKGNEHPRAKLTPEQVQAIMARLSLGDRSAALAREYGVSSGLIGHIKRGRNWRHLTAPSPS